MTYGNSEPDLQSLHKSLPSNEDAERTILGAILLDERMLPEASSALTPDDFYSPKHRRIFAAMIRCREKGVAVDPIMIGEELRTNDALDTVGGVAAITNLTFGLPHFSTIAEYVKLVKSKAVARSVIRYCGELTRQILAEEEPIDATVSAAASKMINFQQNAGEEPEKLEDVVAHVRTMFEAWKVGNDDISSLKTGIPELDGYLKLKGLAKGELTLIGARPSTGKTALMLQIATQVIRHGTPVLFVSLEMLKERLVMRMLPPVSGVANKSINPATFQHQPEMAEKLFEALDNVSQLPMYFDRSHSLPKLLAKAEYFVQTRGVEMVVFDYLTLIHAGIISKRMDTRDAEVGAVTNALKEFAIRTNTVMLGAAQMNRESEQNGGKPKMSGFRESGVIEQAVDVAIFPYDPYAKDNAKNPEAVRDRIYLELYCDKQRDGARGWHVPLTFDKNLQTLMSPMMDANFTRPEPKPKKVSTPVIEPVRDWTTNSDRDEDMPDF